MANSAVAKVLQGGIVGRVDRSEGKADVWMMTRSDLGMIAALVRVEKAAAKRITWDGRATAEIEYSELVDSGLMGLVITWAEAAVAAQVAD